jgi:glycosyltransferase involved in cell wall biosynthesis
MPRILLHVIPTLNIGGAEKQLALLLRGLDRRRFAPVVACTTLAGPLRDEIESAGTPVRVFGKRRGADPLLVWRLARWMRRLRPDLVHTWMFTANTWGRLAALLAGRPPVVASERCVDLWKRALHRGIDRTLARFSACVMANSDAVARFLSEREGISPSRIRVVHNGLDPRDAERLGPRPPAEVAAIRREMGIAAEAPVVGDLARIDAKNDLLTWVEVVARLSGSHPGLVAVLAGEAVLPAEREYAARLRLAIRARGLEGRVRMLGFRRDLERILPALDLLLHTSEMEGFPNSLMEAMAAGLPVVATPAGGTPELVAEGQTALLAPVGDANALAGCASALLDDPQRRRRMGEAGARRVRERFSMRRMVEETERLYDDVLREAGKG